MSNQWLITIGINQYQHFQPLNYALADAQGLWNYMVSRGGFEPHRCLLLTDSSPFIEGQPTYPCSENIRLWIDSLCQKMVQEGDQLWFFFSGYGVKWEGQDYLMPADGNPVDVAATGIPMRELYESLKGSKAETVLVFLDMNHNRENQEATLAGNQAVELARELEIPTILSCQPNQFSYEASDLQHGLFAGALLEALRAGAGLTLANLKRYLSDRLPELSKNHWFPPQEPVVVVHPPEKSHQVILPQQPAVVQSAMDGELTSTAAAVGSAAAVSSAVATLPSQNPFQAALDNVKPAAAAPVEATNGQSPSRNGSSQVEEPDDDDNGGIWQKIMLWGGGLLLFILLLMTTFGRNRLFPAGEKAAQRPAERTAATSSQPTQLNALDKARVLLRTNQASSYSDAIKQASLIQQGDPVYKDALASIERWSRNILDIAQGRAAEGNYNAAIASASLVPQDPQPVYSQAQKLIKQWEPLAKKQQASLALLATAKGLIRPNLGSTYNQAILIASKIPPGNPGYAQAQQSISQWSQSILNLAQQRAASGNLTSAIQTASLVPKGTPAYTRAQQAIARWKAAQ